MFAHQIRPIYPSVIKHLNLTFISRGDKYFTMNSAPLTFREYIALVNYHLSHGKLATITPAQPVGRFGALTLADDNRIDGFMEKPKGDGNWNNAGFFVMQPDVFDYIDSDDTSLEKEPLERLAQDGQLMAFKWNGFGHPMDTLRGKNYLESVWEIRKSGRDH